MSAGMVHHSGKMWDMGHGINGHTDTPSTLVDAIHSCHVHVCMCVYCGDGASVAEREEIGGEGEEEGGRLLCLG